MNLRKAQKLIAAGQFSQAEAMLAGRKDPRASLVLASALRGQGREDDAVQVLVSLTESKPDFLPGHLFLGIALLDAGKITEAQDSITRTLQLQPANDLALSYQGLLLLLQNEQGRASESFRKHGFSDNAAFRVRLTYHMEKQWIATGAYFSQRNTVPDQETSALRASTRLAQKSFFAKRYADMLGHLEKEAAASRPDESVIFFCALGSELLFDYERALRYLERLGNDTKNWSDVLIAVRARCLMRLGRYKEGAQELNRVLMIGPEDYGANYYLGLLCLIYDEPAHARQFFHIAYTQYVVDTLEFQFWQIEQVLTAENTQV